MLARRAARGDLGLISAARQLQDELLAPPSLAGEAAAPLGEERRSVESFKKACVMLFGLAMQQYRESLADQQEVLLYLADMLIDTYAAESAVLRAARAIDTQRTDAALHAGAARLFVNDAALRIDASARQALAAMFEGDMLRTMIGGLRRLFRQLPINTVVLRRTLADEAVARRQYPF
jgi:alkylation response protein AidB-like acyl-CoA dehydrogenase